MNINELKSFLAVVEYHSISLASKKMHITQSAMTKRMQKLELELGIRLFKTTGIRIELTEKGKLCIPYIRQLLQTYEELMLQLEGTSSRPRLAINIGASVYIAQSVLPGVQKYMSTTQNNLLMNIKLIAEQDIAEGLIGGNFDIVISPLHLGYPKTIDFLPLWQENLLLVAAETHPIHSHKKLTLTDLAFHDAALMEKGMAIRQKIDELAWSNGLILRVISEANTIYNNIALTEHSVGWSVIYERLLKPGIVPIKIENCEMNIEFSCYFLAKRKEERIIRVFLDYLQRYFNSSEEFKRFTIKNL